MGLQQIIMIVLGVILVGIAVTVGIVFFNRQAMISHRQSLIQEMNTIMTDAIAYSKMPHSLGGGAGSMWGYMPPGAVHYRNHIGSPANDGCKYTTTECNYFIEWWAPGAFPQRVTITASSRLYGEGNYWPNTYNSRIVASFDAEGDIIRNSSRKGYVISGNWHN